MYILKCANGQYYTGSTTNLFRRLAQHQRGEGANFTRKHLPVELVYYEEFDRIHKAYNRERQIHKWSHKKKEALIEGNIQKLKELAACRNETHYLSPLSATLEGLVVTTLEEQLATLEGLEHYLLVVGKKTTDYRG